MSGKLLEIIKNPYKIFVYFAAMGYFKNMDDKLYLKLMFRGIHGKKLNLKHPKTFNEKLQWVKLYDRNPEYVKLVDKYEVKKYVAERIGEKYIIPTLGVWNSFDEIDFDTLPDRFVLKCTHDSGGIVICKDKANFDMENARNVLTKSLKNNFYYWSREWPYKNVKPRIIAEKYMEDESGRELKDYKVMCFGGEPFLIQLHRGRHTHHTQDFYSTDWELMDFYQRFPRSGLNMERPEFLEEMLELSRKIMDPVPQTRIDWYYANNQLYFGEITLCGGSGYNGFEPEEWDYKLGEKIKLPEKA